MRKNAQAKSSNSLTDRAIPATEFDIRVFHHHNIETVGRNIDWDMFCAEWGVKDEAGRAQLIADGKSMLDRLQREDILDLQGVIGHFNAKVDGDDICIDGHSLPMLRNQTEGEENLSVADFAAASGTVTLFAITAGAGLKAFTENLRRQGDEYDAFMAKVLADRLAEALACEVVPAADGERHAFGYPSCPDHSLKKDVFSLLDVEKNCDMRLTDSFMIDPAESICGMVIPGARYFAVGHITEDQLQDYSRRRGIPEDTLKTLIPRNIQ